MQKIHAQFGQGGTVNLSIDPERALTSKLKMWGVTISEFAQLVVTYHADVIPILPSHELFNQHGPFSGNLEFEFPAPANRVNFVCNVDPSEIGDVGFECAIVD